MTREEEVIKELSVEYLGDSEKIREAKRIAIRALKAMNQIYKITGGYAEALYQSETTFDGVASILTDYFKGAEE